MMNKPVQLEMFLTPHWTDLQTPRRILIHSGLEDGKMWDVYIEYNKNNDPRMIFIDRAEPNMDNIVRYSIKGGVSTCQSDVLTFKFAVIEGVRRLGYNEHTDKGGSNDDF